MYTDEKILLTVERIIHKISTYFNIFEKRIKLIQRVFEIQVSLAVKHIFYTKSYQRKYSRRELRKEQIANFLSKPL